MAGKKIEVGGHIVKMYQKSFSVDGVMVYLDQDNPEKFADQLHEAMERYRRNENSKRRREFMEQNFS